MFQQIPRCITKLLPSSEISPPHLADVVVISVMSAVLTVAICSFLQEDRTKMIRKILNAILIFIINNIYIINSLNLYSQHSKFHSILHHKYLNRKNSTHYLCIQNRASCMNCQNKSLCKFLYSDCCR